MCLCKDGDEPCACIIHSFSSIADREVQRILLELLNQMDGFDQSVNVKVHNMYMYISVRTCMYVQSLSCIALFPGSTFQTIQKVGGKLDTS